MPRKGGKNINMRCNVNCPRSQRFATPDISWNDGMTLKMPDTNRSSIRVHDLEKLLQPSAKNTHRVHKVSDAERDVSAIPDTFVASTSCTRHYSNSRSSTDYYRVGWVGQSRRQTVNECKLHITEDPSHSDTCTAAYRERQSWRARPAKTKQAE